MEDGDDQDLYEDTIREVTGGLVEHNGRTNLPPRPFDTQDQFENMVVRLLPADLVDFGNGNPVIADGEPFLPSSLQGRGFFQGGVENQLISIGNGGYGIFQPGVGWVKTDEGETYILELGNYADSGRWLSPPIVEITLLD